MKQIINKYRLLLLALLIISCETVDLDLQENPNQLGLSSANPDFILNDLQLKFNNQHFALSNNTMGDTRMVNQFGAYGSATNQMNGPWATSYSFLNNFKALETIANDNQLTIHLGIAQVLKAFVYVNLVDYIGTAAYTEALSVDFPNPGLDSGEDIYQAMFGLLDDAIVNLSTPSAIQPQTDLYYNGDVDKWIKLANTLKLKMYLQTRLVNQAESFAGINAIVNEGNYITSEADDFQFRYGTTASPVDSRHPFFIGNYVNVAGQYMSNGFMSLLKDTKSNPDPRLTYYIYRQTDTDPSGAKLPCAGSPLYDFCYIGDGYWGRDHGDDEGIPNDGEERAAYGAYPAGGAYDNGVFLKTRDNQGLQGAGINPILLSSYVQFMLAEANLMLGVTGSANAYLENGIRMSMDKVTGFVAGNATPGSIDNYVNEVMGNYSFATTNEERLDIIITEYYLALFGNGLEAYNNLRRTTFPSSLQEPVLPAGSFPRSFFIPESEISTNVNPDLVQKSSVRERVFWDTNPEGAIN